MNTDSGTRQPDSKSLLSYFLGKLHDLGRVAQPIFVPQLPHL